MPPDDAPAPREPRSLGLRTDLFFHRFEGEVLELPECLAVRTPSNPEFWWGNYLIFPSPPAPGDLPRWLEIYRREIAEPLGVRSVAFTWDDPEGNEGAIEPFLEAGFERDHSVVQIAAATELRPPERRPVGVALRPLARDAEWDELLELQVEGREPRFEEATYRAFRRRRLATYRRMGEVGLGTWFGAFDEASRRLIGSLGIYVERGVARYQSVETHPGWRRRGVASALLAEAARWAQRRRGAHTFVIVADPEYHAAELYRRFGFVDRERQVQIARPDAEQLAGG